MKSRSPMSKAFIGFGSVIVMTTFVASVFAVECLRMGGKTPNEHRREIPGAEGATLVSRVDPESRTLEKFLDVRGKRIRIIDNDLYAIERIHISGERVFVLVQGNYGFFLSRMCDAKGLDFIMAVPEIDFEPVWKLEVEEDSNGAVKVLIEYGCPGEECCAGSECEKFVLEKIVPYGGQFACDSATVPPIM